MRTILSVSRTAMLALLAILSVPALAILPENGWYWNPSESGRGFNIEIQDNIIFMSAFAYHSDGSSAWYVAGGPMSSDRSWSAGLYETSGGQCIGCSYRADNAVQVGTASITFTSERSAVITMFGTSISVERQDWSGLGASNRDALAGEWSTSEGDPIFPIYFSERISLSIPGLSSGLAFLGGSRTGSPGNLAVGAWQDGQFTMLLDSSTSYYHLYIFNLNTFNRAEGLQWVYLKSGSPTGSGVYFLAHRTKSGANIRTGNGPGTSKRTGEALLVDRNAFDAQAAALMTTPGEAPAWVIERAAQLEALLK